MYTGLNMDEPYLCTASIENGQLQYNFETDILAQRLLRHLTQTGLGLFEYAPPSRFYSLCTKNINTYGWK